MIKQTINDGIFEIRNGKRILLTENLVSGTSVYGEQIFTDNSIEFRVWAPKTSKLSAAIHKGLKNTFLKPGSVVLYLGASTGTTVSHVSDIIGNDGMIFAVEVSPTTCRNLVFLAEARSNIAPILADASQPQAYADRLVKVDWLYQDVAQKNQLEIFLKNVKLFLKSKGFAILALKARSIDVAKLPQQIFDSAKIELEKELKVIEQIKLEPFQKDHCFFVCQKS